jgi:hypothetical protein
MKMDFALLCEGASDEGLVQQIERLCVNAGFDEARGVIPEFHRIDNVGKSIADRLRALSVLEPDIEVVFIHRDSDSRDSAARYTEIEDSLHGLTYHWVGVVPVQELEAWLLTDEEGIRYVSENPKGRVVLDIPSSARVELIASPKEKLWEVLILASELTGRRLEKFKKSLSRRRRMLVERMQENAELEHIPSWIKLKEDVVRLCEEVAANENLKKQE